MNNNSKWLIVGSLGVGILGGLYMLLNKKKVVVNVPRERVVLFLKDLKSQTFSQYITTAGVVKKMVKETGGKYQLDNGNTVGDYIRDEVQTIFDEKKNMLLVKHDIDEQDLAILLEENFKNDEEINQLVKDVFDGFENSLKGIEPSLDVRPEVFEILTKEKTISLVKKIMIQSSKSFLSVFEELKQQGEKDISLKNPKFIRKIGQLDMRGRKKKMIKDEGINLEPDSPTEVLGKVTQKYKDQDSDFSHQLQDIDRQYSYVIERLGNEINTEEQIDKVFE